MVTAMTSATGDRDARNMLGEKPAEQFDVKRCLFCLHGALDLDGSLLHMSEVHGFAIPKRDRLLVDVRTLLVCLDSLISEYAQCLYCMTRRHNSHAVKQHMMAKGHCQIDIVDPESEFRDLYDVDSDHEFEEEGIPTDLQILRIDEGSIRLPSGKVLTDRRKRSGRRHVRLLDTAHSSDQLRDSSPKADEMSDETICEQSLDKSNRADRRGIALSTQLNRLRGSDKTSLMHMTPAQQHSNLMTQNKQASRAKKAQLHIESHVQARGNKFLMKHFAADVRGKLNGIVK